MTSVENKLVLLLWKLEIISLEQLQYSIQNGAFPWDDAEWCARGCP